MGRKGITFDMVANAATAIKARGVDPTISAVRKELNDEGSFSTISQHLAKWREQDMERVDIRSLPEEVENAALTAITTIWNIANRQARDEIAALKEDHNRQRKSLQADLDAVLDANRTAESLLASMTLQSENDLKQIQAQEKKLTAVTSELDTTKRLYSELTAIIRQPKEPEPKAADTKPASPSKSTPAPEKTQGEHRATK